ncbi:inorganic pyrophosphatase, partial [Yasminevirus sp. GU-2018]
VYVVETGFFDHLIEKNTIQRKVISPWHDIALYINSAYRQNGVVSMVVEIPKNTREKIEINKTIRLNPLTYDIRNGNIRRIMYKNGYPAHYGALPQTWEDPNHIDERTGLVGDNDPMDAFDLSMLPTQSGEVIHLKVLGCIAMIDQGETDWKVVGINVKDPKSQLLNDIDDVSRDDIADLIDFLRNYKVSEGKGQNTFHYRLLWDRASTLAIIADQHDNWTKLIENNTENHN